MKPISNINLIMASIISLITIAGSTLGAGYIVGTKYQEVIEVKNKMESYEKRQELILAKVLEIAERMARIEGKCENKDNK